MRGCESVEATQRRRETSSEIPLPPSHIPVRHHRRDGTVAAPLRITVSTGESVETIEEGSSGTLTGGYNGENEEEVDEEYFQSEGKMSLRSLIHPAPPPGFEHFQTLRMEMKEKEESAITISSETMGEAFMGLYHSQPAPSKARIETELVTQRRKYLTRYRNFPHADRTADIRLLLSSSPPDPASAETTETETANDTHQTALTPSQYHTGHKLLARKKSDWHLRKCMFFDSPAYKTYRDDLQRKHGDPYERDNCLEFFFGYVLAAVVNWTWSEPILRKRYQLIEHGIRCREGREEDGRGALYSISGPAVRRRKLGEAEEKFGVRGVHLAFRGNGDGDGECERRFDSISSRPELRMRRGRTESMTVTVGGTPERDYSTLDDVGLGNLSAERLAGLGLDSPLSEASERDDAHVEALRFALAGLSHLHHQGQQHAQTPAKSSPQDLATTSTPSKKEKTSVPSTSRNQRRQTKNWTPIQPTIPHHESLNYTQHHQKPRRDSRGDQRDSFGDDGSDDSTCDADMQDTRERLSKEEKEEARRIVDDAKAKRKERKTGTMAGIELERRREKDKTGVEKSFPGRSFF